MFTDTTTAIMLGKVRSCLEKALEEKYKIKDDKITEAILAIHGLNKNNFDFIKNSEMIINERLNDVSIDANSNKNGKTVEGIIQESVASVKKCLGFDYLYKTMKGLYGKDEAKRLMGEMLDLSLALADSTAILKPYCYSFDASKLVTEGRKFGQLFSKPCKRTDSYFSCLGETIHQLSSHLAGAIAIGSFFLDIAHLLLYGEELDLRELKTSKKERKRLENKFQNFVHTVNHLSRSAIESPFTNISIFDKVKLETIVKEMNWYFPFDDLPIDMPKFDNEEEKLEYCIKYIVDYITELQNIFLDFFDKGDPNLSGLPYRFPVCTINISKKKWGEKYVVADELFLKNVCKRDIYRYNIFVSEGTKIASCCRLINDKDMMDLASQANSFGGVGMSLGSHRVVTINFMRMMLESKSKEEFYKIFEERIESCAKILKAHKCLLIELEKKNLQMFITNGWININRLFSTFGISGIYEAAKLYKQKFSITKDVEAEMLEFMNTKVVEMSKKNNILGNLEEIPAESFAIRLCKVDKLLYGEKKVDYVIYSNQFIPLWANTTIWEKMEKEGKYTSLINGGSIAHLQISEKVTNKQAENIIKYAVNCGCEHFALNSVYQVCETGHVTMGKNEKCPECQKDIVDYLTRIVGFFTPVSSWQKERREFDFPNRKFIDIKELDK